MGLKEAGSPVSGEKPAEVGPSLCPFHACSHVLEKYTGGGDTIRQPDRSDGGRSSGGPGVASAPRAHLLSTQRLTQLAFGSECAAVWACVCVHVCLWSWDGCLYGALCASLAPCMLAPRARRASGACLWVTGCFCVSPVCHCLGCAGVRVWVRFRFCVASHQGVLVGLNVCH